MSGWIKKINFLLCCNMLSLFLLYVPWAVKIFLTDRVLTNFHHYIMILGKGNVCTFSFSSGQLAALPGFLFNDRKKKEKGDH